MKIAAFFIRILYRIFCLFPKKDSICFLSKHELQPAVFLSIIDEIYALDPTISCVIVGVKKDNHFTATTVLKQLWHFATSKVCVVDSYIPAVCIPPTHTGTTVIQIWHAVGIVKKFGYQSIGTTAGRDESTAQTVRMHRGYDYALCGFDCDIPALSQAFDMPEEHIVPLGSVITDILTDANYPAQVTMRATEYLNTAGHQLKQLAHPIILYAPTFRRRKGRDYQANEYEEMLIQQASSRGMTLLIAEHPSVVSSKDAPDSDNVIRLRKTKTYNFYPIADYVISDYSGTMIEAIIARKRLLFFLPDYDIYRNDPGLNIDPTEHFPHLCFDDPEKLLDYIEQDFTHVTCIDDNPPKKPWTELETFSDTFLKLNPAEYPTDCTKEIARFVVDKLHTDKSRGGFSQK